MPEEGPRGLESDGTEAASATRVGPAGRPSGPLDTPGVPGPAPPSSGAPGPGTPGASTPTTTAAATGPQNTPAPVAARPDSGPPGPPGTPGAPQRRYLAPWLIAVLVFAVYLVISLFRYLQLDPSSWDLGIFTELVKQYAHLHAPIADIRGTGTNLLGDHFSPIIALIAPFFLAAPSAVTLLVAQAFLTAVSVLPVTWAAAEKLGRRAGAAIGAAYGFSWGLQQMINFDFHEIAFAVPLLAFSLSALVRGRIRAAVAWALPLVFVKEDQGFTVAAIGALMIIISLWPGDPAAGERTGDPERATISGRAGVGRAGVRAGRSSGRAESSRRAAILGGELLIVWGIVWSVLAISVIIPHFNAAHHYQYWSDGGTLSPGGHFSVGGTVRQFFTSWPTKLQTTLMLLLPTVFIALWSPLALIALPSILLRFLGTSSNFWGTQWHYNATVMPIVFIAAVDAIVRIRRTRARSGSSAELAAAGTGPAAASPQQAVAPAAGTSWRDAVTATIDRHGAAAMLAVAVALVFQFPVSNVWNPATYRLGAHVTDANAAMAMVPDGATVTTTLDLLAPLASRTDTFWIGNAGNPDTDYIVFDGPDSGYSPEPTDIPAFVASQHPGVRYNVIYDTGGVYVFRRAGP